MLCVRLPLGLGLFIHKPHSLFGLLLLAVSFFRRLGSLLMGLFLPANRLGLGFQRLLLSFELGLGRTQLLVFLSDFRGVFSRCPLI